MPAVSVVLPVYNGERYLSQALEGIFSQSFRDFEVIAVDDGSTDASRQILEARRDQIVILSQSNGGPAKARNLGVKNSSGNYLAFLDQDDVWYSRKLETQLEVFGVHPEVGLVFSNMDLVDGEGRLLEPRWLDRIDESKSFVGAFLSGHHGPSPSTVLVKRELVEEAGLFDEDLIGLDDVALWFRLHRLAPFFYLDEPLVGRRVHASNLSWQRGRIEESWVIFLRRLRREHEGSLDKLRLIDHWLSRHHTQLGQVYSCSRGWGRAFRNLTEAIRLDPGNIRAWLRLARLPLSAFRESNDDF